MQVRLAMVVKVYEKDKIEWDSNVGFFDVTILFGLWNQNNNEKVIAEAFFIGEF